MFVDKKSLVVVTGASRGIGRSICEAMGRDVGKESTFLLMARTASALDETRQHLLDAFPDKQFKIFLHTIDNASADHPTFKACFESTSNDDYEAFAIFHNAGSLGPQGTPLDKLTNGNDMKDYFAANVFSMMMLNAAFMERIQKQEKASFKYIVNITSLTAIQPFATWSFYCMGKAARDMMFKVLAAEKENDESIRILSYAPGPVETSMVEEVVSSSATSPAIKDAFMNMKSENSLLQPDTTVSKLMKILKDGNYKNGDHVDFYDA